MVTPSKVKPVRQKAKPQSVARPAAKLTASKLKFEATEAKSPATAGTPPPAKPEAAPRIIENKQPQTAPLAQVAAVVAESVKNVAEASTKVVEQARETAQAAMNTMVEEIEAAVAARAPQDGPGAAMKIKQEGFVMVDVIESTKKFADDAKSRFESAFAEMNEKAKVGVEKSTKAMEEISDLAKGNVEALVESGKIAAKGVEALGQSAAEFSRSNFEKTTAAMKSFAAVKSPSEFFQLQSEMMSGVLDSIAKETAKNSEAFLKLAGEVVQPISNRVSIMTDKAKNLSA